MPPKRTSSKYSTIESMGTEMKINIPKERKKISQELPTTQEESKEVVVPKTPKPRTKKRFSPPKTEQKIENNSKTKVKPPHLVKGSEAARQRMSELRAMRGKNKNQTS